MRRGCQWMVWVIVLAGCGGAPDRAPSRAAGGDAPAPAGAAASAPIGRMTATEARAFLATHRQAKVLDVRDPVEWNDDLGHIEGARQIPLAELPGRLGEVDAWRDQPVVVVCRVGVRSQRAAELLAEAGFRQVINLEGGMAAWRRSEVTPGR